MKRWQREKRSFNLIITLAKIQILQLDRNELVAFLVNRDSIFVTLVTVLFFFESKVANKIISAENVAEVSTYLEHFYPESPMRRISEQIRQEYDQLSPTEKRVASFILDHLDDLATYNSVELSRQCGTSKATISRLFRRLGYTSFKEAREEQRRLRQSGVPLPGPRLSSEASMIDRHLVSEMKNLKHVNALAQSPILAEITGQLDAARRIAVIGFRNSYPVALHLRQQLIQIRSAVQLLPQPGQTLSEEIADLTPQDVVVLLAFHRRPAGFNALLKTLQQQGVPVLLISEEQSGLGKTKPDWLIELPLSTVSAFDSYALPMSLVSLISNLLLHHQLDKGRARIEQINQLYDLTEELDMNLSF